jgi:hypothetical protein
MHIKFNLVTLMNNTKWNEIRLAMHSLGNLAPLWRTKDLERAYISHWDNDWFYHFRIGGYKTIEWLELEIKSEQQRQTVLQALRTIRVPGEEIENSVRIYGYKELGEPVDYL